MFASIILSLLKFSIIISTINGFPSDKNDQRCFNYCSNDGICLIENDSPSCYCLPEWEGERCTIIRQSDENKRIEKREIVQIQPRNTPCTYVPNLCNGKGVCYVDDSKKLACQCSYPWDGLRCSEMSVCYEYCFNGGVCTVNSGTGAGAAAGKTPECECDAGFTGTRCESKLTTTAPPTTTTTTGTTTTDVICTFLPDGYCNTGSCVVVSNQAVCECPPTHTGEQCDIPTGASQGAGNPTTPNPLNPGGSGSTSIGGSGSTSPGGSGSLNPTGVTPINPGSSNKPPIGITCANKPCQNNRPCFNNGNSYFCQCGVQFTGTNCETFLG